MRRFVIVVDTQRDFMMADGALAVPGAERLIGPITTWLAGLDSSHTTGVLFTFDTHVPAIYATSPEAEAFPLHCVRGTAGWDNVLDPGVIDAGIRLHRLEKGVFDMWAEPDVMIEDARDPAHTAMPRDAFFEGLQKGGVRDVTVIGVAADYCVKWAMDGLVARDFAVTVPAGLTVGIARQIDRVMEEDFAEAPVWAV